MEHKTLKIASLPRIYEYVDEEGHLYWSFKRPVKKVFPAVRLYNTNRMGQFLMQFVANIKKNGLALWESEQDGDPNSEDEG